MAAATKGSEFSFIIISRGTAGNVVTSRLAENPSVRILVIEASYLNPEQIEYITTLSKAFWLA